MSGFIAGGQGYKTSGFIQQVEANVPNTATQKQVFLVSARERLTYLIGRLVSNNMRLAVANERSFGGIPSQEKDKTDCPPPANHMGAITALLNDLEMLIQQQHTFISKIEEVI
jgi:hypothetical protein